VTEGGGRGVSRRGLLGGLFQRPLKEIRERIPDAFIGGGASPATRAPGEPGQPARDTAPPAPAAPGASPTRMHPPRRLRPRIHTVPAFRDANESPGGHPRYVVDLNLKPLDAGRSWRVAAADLAEPLVLVRVNDTHYAATTGECPLDFSDLNWQAAEDRLWCPGCGSRWRLDGAVAQGPARRELLPLLVDEKAGVVRIEVP